MKWFISIATVLFLAMPALAQPTSPECADRVGEPPTYTGCELSKERQFNSEWCSPQFDTDGDPVESGMIQSCTACIQGVCQTVPVTEPGQLYQILINGKNKNKQISAFCTTSDGDDGEVWVSDICFPYGKPGKPWWKFW